MSKRAHDDEGIYDNKIVRLSDDQATGRTEAQQFSIPGLRFATESWAGMKTTNEDRHVSSVEYFPGPVFGIFDGHGGPFTADFLVRQLIKTVASTIRQTIGEKALEALRNSQRLSRQEKDRNQAIEEQLQVLQQQQEEVDALRGSSDTEEAPAEFEALLEQLKKTVEEMKLEIKQIDEDEVARREERRHWHEDQKSHFLKAFKDAFERVDEQILKKNHSRDGSTALLAWFVVSDSVNAAGDANSELSFFTANVGDCRAVMCRGGRGVPLTSDHKPNRPDERKRIQKAGGFVGKVAGISRVYSAAGAGLAMQQEVSTYLAVSRAFGDSPLKTPTPLISCEPEVKQCQVENDDLFLVLTCDGVWDVLSEQDVVEIALPHFEDAKAAANAIVKAAYKKGSADNLTATVIQFGWQSDASVDQAIVGVNSRVPNPQAEKKEGKEEQSNVGEEEEIDMFS